MKKLAQYSVCIRERDFRKLQSIGAVEEPFENIYAITNPNFYKADTGLSIDNQWLEETYII
jgi:CRISPR-associated endonuclease/helicase Cas3